MVMIIDNNADHYDDDEDCRLNSSTLRVLLEPTILNLEGRSIRICILFSHIS